jgi:branched-chain amino acid transport system permease protein
VSGGRPEQKASALGTSRLLPNRSAALGLGVLAVAYLAAPLMLSDSWLTVLDYAGIAAVGALGLNLLTGSTGQVSLGHAPFLGLGAYVAAVLGAEAGLPLPVWMLGAALVSAAVGAAVGRLTLGLGQTYTLLMTLALVFLGEHVYTNWDGLTGGPVGREVVAPASLGIDFDHVYVAGRRLTRAAGWFWLVWGVAALSALGVANVLRTRPGRAMQAVRDGELSARVIGVDATRIKIRAFVVASALAGVAGSLLASFQRYVAPAEWTVLLSIQYLAMIIVGGMGRVSGAIVGAVFITALPSVIERYSQEVPGLIGSSAQEGILSVFALDRMLFGSLIIGFLVFEPRGLVALWERGASRLRSWMPRPARLTTSSHGP